MIRQFPLEELRPTDFEKLVVLICERILGTGTINFTEGIDGGRDAVFKGRADHFPSSSNPWEGKIVIQAKHFKNPLRSCSDSVFKGKLRKEVNGPLKKLVAGDQLDYYLLFTNAKLGGNTFAGLTDFIDSNLVIENRIIGVERILFWLDEYPEIVKTMDLNNLLMPLQFYPEDLKDIILKFSTVSGQVAQEAEKKKLQFRSMALERKNELNRLSKEYFDFIKEKSLAHFNQIKVFLNNPLNRKYLKYYENTTADLQAKIIVKRSEYHQFEELLEELIDFVFHAYPEMRDERNLIRVFLHYMYSNCDIGLDE
jgi:hypothetical protein